jgi:peroxiredoxin
MAGVSRLITLLLFVALTVAPLAHAAPAAPGFRVKLMDGSSFDSREALGKKVVVVRFQASYCKPCVKESVALSRLTERYAPRGVEFLALHVQDTAADVRRFMKAQRPGYAIALDPKLVIGNRFGAKGTPYTVVIDGKGEIIARLPGESATSKLPRILDDALSPTPPKR